MGEFDEIIEEFLIESNEGLDQLDQDLVALEERPNDRELLARIFRCAHTIKGTSGFIGLSKLEALTHAGETLLSKMRDGELSLTPDITTLLLEMVDAIRKMLESVRAAGNDGESDYAALIELLKLAALGSSGAAQVARANASKKPRASAAPRKVSRAPASAPRAATENASSPVSVPLPSVELSRPVELVELPVAAIELPAVAVAPRSEPSHSAEPEPEVTAEPVEPAPVSLQAQHAAPPASTRGSREASAT
ncbi:MAG TPA: Hpt domain-containing protein, partial [Polyangiaceae bacterium]|nr:Hpt domain-containing protein [Polyangiaceae bacterium]